MSSFPSPHAPTVEPDALLALLRSRRSARRFGTGPIERARLERLVEAARTAPSATNRQPWRFVVVTSARVREAVARAVAERSAALQQAVAGSAHAEDLGGYTDFFHEPLERAAALVVPAYRELPDLLGGLLRRSGVEPSHFSTERVARTEHLSCAAATMNLLLMAEADGLAACWMAGPLLAADAIEPLVELHAPWRALGVVALGPKPAATGDSPAPAPPPRKPLAELARFLED